MKLYTFGTWNNKKMYYEYAGYLIAENEELAETEAKKEFPDDEIEVWEVKVHGYEIKLVKDGE